MKVLVTGAAGFLGSHLCEELLKNNYMVVGVDNFFRGKKENLPHHPNFTFRELDLIKFEVLKDFMESHKFDIVVHYAAINGTRYFYDIPYRVCNDNIVMTQNLLNSCTQSVQKIVYASSSEVYGPSPSIPTKETDPIILHTTSDRDSYASSKSIGEFLIRLWALKHSKNYLIIRPFNTYGPRMSTGGYGQVVPEFIERVISTQDFFLYGDGNQTRSFCYVDDHTDIVTKLIPNCNNEIVNVGFDEEVTINDLAILIHSILNKELKISYRPSWDNDTKWRKPSLFKLKSFIDNKNFVPLREGIDKMLNYYGYRN